MNPRQLPITPRPPRMCDHQWRAHLLNQAAGLVFVANMRALCHSPTGALAFVLYPVTDGMPRA